MLPCIKYIHCVMDAGGSKVADVAVRQARPYKRLLLNIPPELYDRLRDLAQRERRPLSTQTQILLERALDLEQNEAKAVVAA